MSDWNLPTVATNYVDVIAKLKERDEDSAKMFDGSGTELPVGTVKWDSGSSRWKKLDASNVWQDLTITYDISVSHAATSKDAEKFGGLDTSHFLRADEESSGAHLNLDSLTVSQSKGVQWNSGAHAITHNDGGGSVQLRFGNRWGASNGGADAEIFTQDFTAFYLGGNVDANDGKLSLKVASNGGAGIGEPVTWGSALEIGATTLTYGGNTVYHAGNISSATVSNSDKVDGLHASQFVRSDANDTKTGNLTFNDNARLNFGTGNDIEHFWNGSNYYTDINAGANWYLRDGNSSNATRFTFDIDTGNLTVGGDIFLEGGKSGDTGIHFWDANDGTHRTLRWDDSANGLTMEANNGGHYAVTLSNSGRALNVNALRRSGANIQIYKGDGSYESESIGSCVAALGVGAVGSYALMYRYKYSNDDPLTPGTTKPGSELDYATANGNKVTSPTPAGNWRLMGYFVSGGGAQGRTSLWLRIS